MSCKPIQSQGLSAASTRIILDALNVPTIIACVAGLKLLIHFYFNALSYYGYLRDELYFIEAGKRLDWGYVDIGPLTIWMGRLSSGLMGDSVFALRFFPAIAGAVTIVLVGLMVRELGGGRFAQALAALAMLVAPIWLGAQNNACAYFLTRLIKTGNLLIVFGVELEVLRLFFGEVGQAATITCLQAVTYEQNVPVYVCRKPIIYLKDAWPRLRAHAFLNG